MVIWMASGWVVAIRLDKSIIHSNLIMALSSSYKFVVSMVYYFLMSPPMRDKEV